MSIDRNVAVLGAGIMGPGIAQVFAAHGCRVVLADPDPKASSAAAVTLASNLDLMRDLELIGQAEVEGILDRIAISEDPHTAVSEAGIVVEAVSEKPAVKSAVFRSILDMAPADAAVWSNTSSLDVFALAPEELQERLLIAHWFAPPHILPLVEVVKGPSSAPALVEQAVTLLKSMGRTPVLMERYVPGFVINRLLRALGREAFYLIDNGYISAEDLDLATRSSLAVRMLVLGVIQRYDFTGLDLSVANLRNKDFVDAPVDLAPRSLTRRVEAGDLGVRSGRGFYDYPGTEPHEASRARDALLWRIMASCGDMAVAPRNV